MIGVASLSLAACGSGGDSTVQTAPAQIQTPPDDREPDPDCTAVPRPVGCEPRKPSVPLPLDGLGDSFKTGAAVALREVADTNKVRLTFDQHVDSSEPWKGRLAIQGVQLRNSQSKITSTNLFSDTKIVDVIPRKNGDNIVYSFGLYTPQVQTYGAVFSTGLRQIITRPLEHKIFSLDDNDDYTSVKRIESITTQFGEDWDYSILKASVPSVKGGAKDSTLYAELWTDVASAGENDYMVGGWWLLAPNDPAGDYRFGVLAKGQNYYYSWTPSPTGPVKAVVEGTATYKGNASGLYRSSENGMVSIQRLLGKATLTADFGDATASSYGTIGGKINNLNISGDRVRGEILLPKITLSSSLGSLRFPSATNNNLNPKTNVGNIEGINYQGDWAGNFLGDSSGTDQPTGIVGVVGGSGGGNSFVASFGAKKEKAE